LGGSISAVRVDGVLEVADHLPQPGRVQAAGGVQQGRFGRVDDVVGLVQGAGGQHLGMGGRELPIEQRRTRGWQGPAEQGPGGTDRRGGLPGGHAQADP
jgi:hypothetical protein